MRRRRKPRVVWLPLDPNNTVQGQGGINAATDPVLKQYSINISSGADIPKGTQFGFAAPVVGDVGNAQSGIIGTANPDAPSFSDLFNSGYRLRRIVGQIAVALEQASDTSSLNGSCSMTVGFQIMRVDNSGLPVDVQAANTMAYNTTENPWIWRRTWFLTNFGTTRGQTVPVGSSSNFGGGSIREGQFMDQKTARIVGPDERLFLCATAELLDDNAIIDQPRNSNIYMYTDLRVLASLRTNVGNRRNASR